MYELEALNPSVSESSVYKHIQKLVDAGIVKELALADDQRRQGYPWKFYGLTEAGREFLEDHSLLAAEETLQQIYETNSDKPERMVNCAVARSPLPQPRATASGREGRSAFAPATNTRL